MELRTVRLDNPLAAPLLEGLASEYEARYGSSEEMRHASPEEFDPPGGTFVVLLEEGQTIAGGGIRPLSKDVCEVKRMWTAPGRRREGHASLVLAELEAAAAALGYGLIRLETGPSQPEALSLYEHFGYRRIPVFGRYDRALAFERAIGVDSRPAWDGERYKERFDELASKGAEVHGEAGFVRSLSPLSVLDVGCGTGRVALELSRHSIEVVGVDRDASMLAVARRDGPGGTWIEADMTTVDLGRTFDLVLMAGNVPLFTPPRTETVLVARCAAHLGVAGVLVAGFQLDGRYEIDAYDADCARAGLDLLERFSTWDRRPYLDHSGYAVSVHGRSGQARGIRDGGGALGLS